MGTKISELTEYEDVQDNDVIPIVDVNNSATKKITKSNFLKSLEQHRYHLTLEEEIEDNSEIEIPCYYKVGNDSLQVYFEGELLEKDVHYTEIRRR